MVEVFDTRTYRVFRICPDEEAARSVCRAYAHLPLGYLALPDVSQRDRT